MRVRVYRLSPLTPSLNTEAAPAVCLLSPEALNWVRTLL